MSTLPKSSRKKLAKLLALADADAGLPGCREATILNACKLVKASGLTWAEILDPPAPDHQLPAMGVWRQTVAACLQRPERLRPWEVTFLYDLPRFRRVLVKQRYVLREITDRVLRGGQ